MFLIHCLGVLTVVFWLSALVAEAWFPAAVPVPMLRIVAHSKGEAFVNVKADGRDTR